MKLLTPKPLPYDPLEWVQRPLHERGRMVCEAWAMQGYGTPLAVYAVYAVEDRALRRRVGLLLRLQPSSAARTIGEWWLTPVAFQKAILWSMLFEGLGLGCGSGPLTGRYFPPIGGVLYFAAPGHDEARRCFRRCRCSAARGAAWLDVALYLALVGCSSRRSSSPSPDRRLLIAIALVVPVLGLADRTIFLALRGEHYWTTIVCFAFARELDRRARRRCSSRCGSGPASRSSIITFRRSCA